MAEIINMPRLSDTMEEGTVAKWFKKVGDKINEGDILAEIETDKATMEFESFNEGELLHIGIQEGGTAPVDTLLAIIGEKDEDISSLIKSDGNTISNDKEGSVAIVSSEEVSPTENTSMPEGAELITMPRLSDTMEEGTVATWNKKVGDIVNEGDILAEIETDKATMEFEAFYAGELLHIGIQEGGTAPVDTLLAIIGEKGEDISAHLDGGIPAAVVEETAVEAEASEAVTLPSDVEIITMPRLSDTMEEGTVAKWLKSVGDKVEEGDMLAEIETDKATMEFESFNEGTLLYIGVQEGDAAPVDTLLAIIGDDGEDISSLIGGGDATTSEDKSSPCCSFPFISEV